MQYLGIEYTIKNLPELDPNFIPLCAWMEGYEKQAKKTFAIAVEGEDGRMVVHKAKLIADEKHEQADYCYVERLVKFLLWSAGGFRIYLCGTGKIGERLKSVYAADGARQMDFHFMEDVFEKELEICCLPFEDCPKANTPSISIGGHCTGCRIGFDAGGSDRKVSALIDGEPVYSEEVIWNPKPQSDPQYHLDEIVKALKSAAAHLPRVDAIGISSAGVLIGNSPMVASLFIKVPREKRSFVKSIFDDAAKQIGDGRVPVRVANDGDVTALSGAMGMEHGSVMGIAMGTSEAVGYVDEKCNILGYFNELAFAPVDLNQNAARDEWSGDIGVGCKYFSQDAVIKLAPAAGIALDETLTPAEKLCRVQELLKFEQSPARRIFRSIGTYLAHTLPLYCAFYDIRSIMVLGRVLSGEGGNI